MGFWSSLLPIAATVGGTILGGPVGGAIGGALGGGATGAMKNADAKRKQKATGDLRAAEQRYGWINGRNPTTEIEYAGNQAADIMGGALSGGATGWSLGQGAKDFLGGGLFSGGGGTGGGTPGLLGRSGSTFGLGVDTDLGGGGAGRSMYADMLGEPSQMGSGSTWAKMMPTIYGK